MAPEKCAILPISSNDECNKVVDDIAKDLMESDLAIRVDTSSAAIGRRYARADELGIPFAVTVDFDTLKTGIVTLRERDSMSQVLMPREEVTNVLFLIVHNKMTWDDVVKKFPMKEAEGAQEATVIETTARGSFRRPAPAK